MALPERRKATAFQKAAVGLLISNMVALLSFVFWFGGQSKTIDDVAAGQKEQAAAISQLNDKTAQISGQVLQMATTSNMAQAEQRIGVLEARQNSNEQLLRELKADMVDRLRRIEGKLDRSR